MPTRFLRRSPDAGLTVAVPRLLVSVRSAEEANSAIRGGAEILDVKEPNRGSLGMADIQVIRDIATRVAVPDEEMDSLPPLSVALGELRDWVEITEFPSLPREVIFAKLGLSPLNGHGHWRSDWLRVREQFDQQRDAPLRWVGVAYADPQSAQSPSVDDIIEASIESGCAGLLIDTFAKHGSTLLQLASVEELARIAERCHSAGLFFAVAGRLSLSDLPQISGITLDVLAIRSAACIASDRVSQVDGSRVEAFRKAIAREFTPNSQR